MLGGWLVAGWQLTLGFTLGLQLVYLLGILGILAVAGLAAKRLPRPPRAVTIATLAGVLVLSGVAALQARPYLRVVDQHPEARRTESDVLSYSPPLRSFLAAPAESFLWKEPFVRARAPLPDPAEEELFPGLTIGLLAAVGLAGSVFSRRLRIGLGVGVVVCGALSLGLREGSGWHRYVTPYRLLFELAPGWDGVRTPGRINTLTSLGLALLPGAGMCIVVRAVGRAASRGRLRRIAVPAVAASFAVGILVEGLGPLPHPEVPPVLAAARRAEPPVLHLPWTEDDTYTYMYWSTAGFPGTVNGIGGFDPDLMRRLRRVVRGFPDERSVTALRRLGVRTVLLHRGLAPGTAWSRAGRRSIRGLPLERRNTNDTILYVIAPPRSRPRQPRLSRFAPATAPSSRLPPPPAPLASNARCGSVPG